MQITSTTLENVRVSHLSLNPAPLAARDARIALAIRVRGHPEGVTLRVCPRTRLTRRPHAPHPRSIAGFRLRAGQASVAFASTGSDPLADLIEVREVLNGMHFRLDCDLTLGEVIHDSLASEATPVTAAVTHGMA